MTLVQAEEQVQQQQQLHQLPAGTAQEQLDQRTDHAQGRHERAAHEEEPGEQFQELDEAAKEAPTPIGIKTYSSHVYTQSQGQHEQLLQVDRLEGPSQEPDHQKQNKQEPGPQAATDAQSLIGNEAHDDDTRHTHTLKLGKTYTHTHSHTHAPEHTQTNNHDDDVFYLFLQKQKIALRHIPLWVLSTKE